MDPGAFGFLILIPLTLASGIALIVGTVLTLMVGRSDSTLLALLAGAVIVIAIAIFAFSDSLPFNIDGLFIDVLIAAYGLTAICLSSYWLAVRRNRSD